MVILKFSMNRYPYRDRNRYRTGILGEILFRKVPVCFTYVPEDYGCLGPDSCEEGS